MNYKKPNQICNNEKHPVAIMGGGIFKQTPTTKKQHLFLNSYL